MHRRPSHATNRTSQHDCVRLSPQGGLTLEATTKILPACFFFFFFSLVILVN